MTNIKEVLATNLKKFRRVRGWSQAVLAEKIGTSIQYIWMMETKGKYPSAEMIHKLSKAFEIDPTELFYKEIDMSAAMKEFQKVTVEDLGELIVRFIKDFLDEKVRELEEKTGENNQNIKK
jgi:transcriptional regulator with XRE-family HTH domain